MDLLILALATWRITSLFVEEEGPYLLFVRLRKFIGVDYNEYSEVIAKNEFAKMFTCIWCLSIWVSIFVTVVYIIVGATIFLPFALSAIAILIHEWQSKE